MKLAKLWLVMAAFTTVMSLEPMTGWATRALGATVTGSITASPSPTAIEVDHKAYHIQANSAAAKNARSFFLGQVVDIILNRPAGNTEPVVVSIAGHVGM